MKRNKPLRQLLVLSLLTLAACGGVRDPLSPLPGQPTFNPPTYNPGDNLYTPKPDTHGYNPNQPSVPTYSVLSNVFLRVDPEIGAQITRLEGRLEPKRSGDPVIFDDVRSFVFNIYNGQLSIDAANISRLKNKYTFNYPDSPLKDIQINFSPGRISMKGKMKQVIWVPFEMEGTLQPAQEGTLVMIPDAIRVAGIPVKGLMDAIGLQTSKLLKIAAERGVQLQGNNILLDCTKLFPPPQIQGRIAAVDIQDNRLTLMFDNQQRIPKRLPPDTNARNYMYVYGGNVLIMNELQRGAELQMVDMKPTDSFDFFMNEYRRHLRAGYVKVVNDLGTLITLMPDYPLIPTTQVWDQYPGGAPALNPGFQRSAALRGSL